MTHFLQMNSSQQQEDIDSKVRNHNSDTNNQIRGGTKLDHKGGQQTPKNTSKNGQTNKHILNSRGTLDLH